MDYMKLDVWQEAMNLTVEIYALSSAFPKDERFGLTAQLRRAAVSVPSNVAEDEGRRSWRDRANFYTQARGSLHEVETQLILAERLGYCETATALLNNAQHVGRLINGVLRNLNSRTAASR